MGLCGRVFKARLIRLGHLSVMCEEGGHTVALRTNARFAANIVFHAHRGFEESPRESHPAVARST